MVPIHDTDVAHERWSKAEWENYELWEKVELRLRRKRRLWIFATFVVFLTLSAVPIVADRWPKWMTRSAARILAQELNRMKREASLDRAAYRLKFLKEGDLSYVVERLPNCNAEKGEKIRSSSLNVWISDRPYTWITTKRGAELGIPGLAGEFCYDYLAGNSAVVHGEAVVGFGMIPANDLTEGRLDRLSILLLSGPSGEGTFD